MARSHSLPGLAPMALAGAFLAAACGADKAEPTPSTEALVGAAGGEVAFANGVRLVFPPAALARDTPISVVEVPLGEIDAIVSRGPFGSFGRRALAAFEVAPSGLAFPSPVTMRFPTPPLRPGEFVVHVSVARDTGAWRVEATDLAVDGQRQETELKLSHFSTHAAIAFSSRGDACRNPFTWTLEECWDRAQDPCCSYADEFRPPGCRRGDAGWEQLCCREVAAKVTSLAMDSAGSACDVVSELVRVEFPACPPYPLVEDLPLADFGTECSDYSWRAEIVAPERFELCVPAAVSVRLTGRSPDGTVTVGPTAVAAALAALPADAADLTLQAPSPTTRGEYLVTGRKETPALVLGARIATDGAASLRASLAVPVVCRYCSLELTLGGSPGGAGVTMARGSSLDATAILRDASGGVAAPPPDPSQFRWTVGDPGKLGPPVPGTGTRVSIEALAAGETTLTVTWDDGCERRTATTTVRVVGIEVAPSLVHLPARQSTLLKATADIPGYSCPLAWRSDTDVVVITPEGPDSARVTAGPNAGVATVTAECGEYRSEARVLVSALVVSPASASMFVGERLALRATLHDPSGVPYETPPCQVSWYSGWMAFVSVAQTGPASAEVAALAPGAVGVYANCGGGIFGASGTWAEASIDILPPAVLPVHGEGVFSMNGAGPPVGCPEETQWGGCGPPIDCPPDTATGEGFTYTFGGSFRVTVDLASTPSAEPSSVEALRVVGALTIGKVATGTCGWSYEEVVPVDTSARLYGSWCNASGCIFTDVTHAGQWPGLRYIEATAWIGLNQLQFRGTQTPDGIEVVGVALNCSCACKTQCHVGPFPLAVR